MSFSLVWQMPETLSSTLQTTNVVNIKEIPNLMGQLDHLQAKVLELETQLQKEKDDKQELEVNQTILKMEFKTEKDSLQNELDELKKDKNELLAAQVDNEKRLAGMSLECQALTSDRDKIKAELNKTKADLKSKLLESTTSPLPIQTWKPVRKCLNCRNTFGNGLRGHLQKAKPSAEGSSSSSTASSVASLRKKEESSSSTNILSCSSDTASETIPSLNTATVAQSSSPSKETPSPSGPTDTSSTSVSETPPNDNEANRTETIAENKSPTCFEFQTPKTLPAVRACSVALTRRIQQPLPVASMASCSMKIPNEPAPPSVVVEFQGTGQSSSVSTVTKHTRDVTQRYAGFYCSCGIRFLDRNRLNRHLSHQKLIQNRNELPVLNQQKGKKRSNDVPSLMALKQIKVEQKD